MRSVPRMEQVGRIAQALSASSNMPAHASTVAAKGLRTALKALQLERMTIAQSRVWLETARLESVLGSCRRSLPSAKSGLQYYVAFVKAVAGNSTEHFFPPKLEWLQAWASLFRNSRTFSNYLGYVRVGCLVVKADTEIFEHPAVVRAKHSIEKAGLFAAREKLWIRSQRVEAFLIWAQKHPAYLNFAYVFLSGCIFMQRIPSEALPMVVAAGETQITSQSVICI